MSCYTIDLRKTALAELTRHALLLKLHDLGAARHEKLIVLELENSDADRNRKVAAAKKHLRDLGYEWVEALYRSEMPTRMESDE